MAIKHTEHILEILKKSGPLPAAAIKQRVLARMNLAEDDYPKSTFQGHLEKLHDDEKIKYRTEENKRIYFVPKYEHPVPGGLFLENLEGRIHVPPHLLAFDIEITQDLIKERSRSHFILVFEFYNEKICLNIHKHAVPFNLHISRTKFTQPIYEKINQSFGNRTITLELPVTSLSSFKEGETGHAFIAFLSEENMFLKNLGAKNPLMTTMVQSLNLENFAEELSQHNDRTYTLGQVEGRDRVSWLKKGIDSKQVLNAGETYKLKLPELIFVTPELTLTIFNS